MNNSWLSDGNSPGFMYYTLDETPAKSKSVETSDFISFSETHNPSPSPQAFRFNPTSYSSPQNFRRGSPKNYNRGWKRSHNIYNSPNTSYNSNSSKSGSRDSSFHSFKSRNSSLNKSYIHPSFMEDPWANLQRQLDQKRNEQQQTDNLSNNPDKEKEQVT